MSRIIKIILYLFFTLIVIMIQSCVGCSNSGRSKIIAMAKVEASKNKTVPKPNTIIKNVIPKTVEIEEIVTPKEEELIKNELIKNKIPPAIGKLIQVEGLILKEVMELTIKLNTSDSQIEQILAMKNYVQSNWHYIFDPEIGSDTWRSAEATLSLKYKGQYSGDCDDFAILLASMARQIGLKSRMIGGYNNGDGHAFAEFLIPSNLYSENQLNNLDYRKDDDGIWVSLDWFKGKEHKKYTNDILIFDDI